MCFVYLHLFFSYNYNLDRGVHANAFSYVATVKIFASERLYSADELFACKQI